MSTQVPNLSEEGQTAEHTPDIEDTPPTTGPNGDFIPDHLWFANAGQLDDVGAVYPDGSNSGGIPQEFFRDRRHGASRERVWISGVGGQGMKGGTGTDAGKAYGGKGYINPKSEKVPDGIRNDICYILGSFQHYQFTRGTKDFGNH